MDYIFPGFLVCVFLFAGPRLAGGEVDGLRIGRPGIGVDVFVSLGDGEGFAAGGGDEIYLGGFGVCVFGFVGFAFSFKFLCTPLPLGTGCGTRAYLSAALMALPSSVQRWTGTDGCSWPSVCASRLTTARLPADRCRFSNSAPIPPASDPPERFFPATRGAAFNAVCLFSALRRSDCGITHTPRTGTHVVRHRGAVVADDTMPEQPVLHAAPWPCTYRSPWPT